MRIIKSNIFLISDCKDDFTGYWYVTSKKLHSMNPWNWRRTIVFHGSKKECIKYIQTNDKNHWFEKEKK